MNAEAELPGEEEKALKQGKEQPLGVPFQGCPVSSTGPVLSLKGISKSFRKESILEALNLDVNPGEFITLLGPSGCGKTTILRIIAGLEHPDSGEILLHGEPITHLSAESRPIHTIFQNYALFPHMNIFENVAFGLRMKGISRPLVEERVQEALAWVHLEGHEARLPDQLSGGQKQRVAIARAIINQPRLLLLDECLSALDHNLRKKMQNELKGLQRKLKIPFLFVTHDQEEALSLSDRIVVLRQGKIEQQGDPRAIYEEPNNIFVAKFIGASNIFKAKVKSVTAPYAAYVEIEGKDFEISCKGYLASRRKELGALVGQEIYVLLRPEDLRITELEEGVPSPHLIGTILERNYKGMTLDSVIQLDTGKVILASEFFNEDDPDVDRPLHQRVSITWVNGWEVLLDA